MDSGASPAAVLERARDQVGGLDNRLVTGFSDADLVEGLAAARAWQGGQLVVHTAGRFGVGVLAPARAAGAIPLAVHPAMTFTGTSLDLRRLVDCACAVTAPAPVLPVAQALVVEVGAEPVVVVGYRDPTIDFTGCRRAGTLRNDVGIDNEEEGGPVWVCDGPNGSWSARWHELSHYDA